jgi:hypothetical protein
VVLVLLLGAAMSAAVAARQTGVEELGERLRENYNVVAIEGGVGLVPRAGAGDVRIIEIRDGAIAVDGEALTGQELRERLGVGADLVLRVSYLEPDAQRELLGAGAPAAAEPPPAADDVPRRSRQGGDVVRVMGNVNIARDERVEGDVVAVMGNANVDGEVDGDVNVVMGNLDLGPEAVVRGDVHIVGGNLNRAPGSRIEGSIDNVVVGSGGWSGSTVPAMVRDSVLGRLGSLAGTLLRIALLGLMALLVVAVGRTPIERIADRTAADPLRAGLVGFVAQLLFFPLLIVTIVVLAVSIIGIPLLLLLPFGIILLLVVLLVGFTGVAYHAGRILNERFGWTGRGPYATVILGVVTIALVTVIARSAAVAGGTFFSFPLTAVGYLVEYLAWTLGFGGAILAFLHARRTLPPLPAG